MSTINERIEELENQLKELKKAASSMPEPKAGQVWSYRGCLYILVGTLAGDGLHWLALSDMCVLESIKVTPIAPDEVYVGMIQGLLKV